jgi:hypothetical protein
MAGRKVGDDPKRRRTHNVKRTETYGAKTIETLSRISQK